MAVVVGILYFGLAGVALALTEGADGVATLWPSSGVAVAGLLLARQGERIAVVLAIALASLMANYLWGGGARVALAFTCANLVEALVAYRLMAGIGRQEGRQGENLFTIAAIARFCLAVLAAATISATIACLLSGRGPWPMFLSWLSTVGLGMMIVVPLIMAFMQAAARRSHAGMSMRELVRTVVVLALIAAISIAVFAQSTYPLLFLPLLGVLAATYFLGPTGATCSTLIIAVIGSYAAWRNDGAITTGYGDPAGTVLFFQFYLFVLLASSLPLAALIAMRDRSFAEVERGKRWLEMSESISKVGHWRVELPSMRLFWSSEIFRIHGLVPGTAPTVQSAVEFYHPDDRVVVENSLKECLERNQPMSFEARIVRPDGECRHIYSCSEVERLDDGTPVAIFGIFQDVTARVLAAMELSSARADAEARAMEAMALAETDPLTGIANRRKVFAVLEAEVARAESQGTELSLAVLDIDRFKQVNDRFGHAVGDQVIRRIAQICAMMIRNADFVGRIGGEEFVIVLSGMGAEMAVATAERLRRAIENEDWTPLEIERVTASIGLTSHAPGLDRDQLLARADGALYRAKQDGRNRLRQAA